MLILLVVLVLVVAEVVYVWIQSGGYYAISPGTAPVVSDQPSCQTTGPSAFTLSGSGGRPCVRLVLPAGKTGQVHGSIFMVDVLLGKATPWQYFLQQVDLLHRAEDGTVLYTNAQILGTTPASQLGCQDSQQMSDAIQAAEVEALRTLHYSVGEQDLGAQLDEVAGSTPASAAGLDCNDLIIAFDGHPITGADALVAAVHSQAPGAPFTVTVRRTVNSKTSTVLLHGHLSGTPALDGQPAQPHQAFLGVESETRSNFQFPFPIDIKVGAIGGPSAGLALTLGLLDSLTGGQLTDGHRIAATGTIDLNGDVGDVGGVAQKTVAVRRAGAELFFVPVQEAAAARSEARGMKIYPVSSLSQAVSILESMGGRLPAAGGSSG